MLKSFLNDAKFYFIVRGVLSVAFLLSIKIYTHFLDTVDYGVYAIVFFIITIFSVCTTSWLSVSIIRLYPEWAVKNVDHLPTMLTLLSVTILIFSPVLYILLYFSKVSQFLNIGNGSIFFCIGYFVCLSIFNFLMARFTAMRNVKLFTFYSIVQYLLGVTIAAFFLKETNMRFNGIILGQTLSYFIFCVILVYKQNLFHIKFYIKKDLFSQITSYGLPILLLNIASNLLISSDQLVLKYFNFNEQVGAYAANYTLTDKSITVLTGIFTTAYTPIMFSIFEQESKKKAYRFFVRLVGLYFVVILPLVLTIYFFYDNIFKMLIDNSYRMVEIIPYILLGSLFLNISNLFSDILTLNKNTKLLALCYLLPLAISLLLNFVYIPIYGAKAAAIVTSISYFCLMVSVLGCAFYYILQRRKSAFS